MKIDPKEAKKLMMDNFDELPKDDLENAKVDQRQLNELTPLTVNNGDKMLVVDSTEACLSALTSLEEGSVLELEEGKVGIHFDQPNAKIHLWVKP